MDPKTRLQDIRSAIAELDEKLVTVLEQRAKLSKEVRGIAEIGGGLADLERDGPKIPARHGDGDLPPEALRTILAQVHSTARAIERPVRVAYVGAEGGFGHQMAKTHFGAGATFIECATVPLALEEVQRQRASFCTFPFDSSVDGLILPAVSALAVTDLMLVAERTLPAKLCLMTASGRAADIERVISTSVGHASSELFRKSAYPGVTVVDVRSPIEAAELAKSDPRGAAIVPEAAGRERGLEVATESVGNEPDLRYRYGIVGTRPTSRSGNDTTCLLFSLDDAPGTLFQVLGQFAERGINLKKIQSRPVRGGSWDYVFYVEVSGHGSDRGVVTALEAVKGSTKYLKLLGSFPTEA